jgi:hypothetical protein
MRTGSGRCAYIDRVTSDGRLIKELRVRDTPLPLTMEPTFEAANLTGGSTLIGRVTLVEVFPDAAYAAVEITEDWAIPVLEAEQHYMEIDLDDLCWGDMHYSDDNHTMEIASGRLYAIHLGTHPCWDGLEFRLNP